MPISNNIENMHMRSIQPGDINVIYKAKNKFLIHDAGTALKPHFWIAVRLALSATYVLIKGICPPHHLFLWCATKNLKFPPFWPLLNWRDLNIRTTTNVEQHKMTKNWLKFIASQRWILLILSQWRKSSDIRHPNALPTWPHPHLPTSFSLNPWMALPPVMPMVPVSAENAAPMYSWWKMTSGAQTTESMTTSSWRPRKWRKIKKWRNCWFLNIP